MFLVGKIVKAAFGRSFGVGLVLGTALYAWKAARAYQQINAAFEGDEDRSADRTTEAVATPQHSPALIRWWESD